MTQFSVRGEVFGSIVKVAEAIDTRDIGIRVDGPNLVVCGVDVAGVGLIEATYILAKPVAEPFEIGQSVERLKKGLVGFEDEDEVEVSLEGMVLVLKAGRKRRRIASVHLEAAHPKAPSLEWTTRSLVPLKPFREAMRRSLDSDCATLTSKPNVGLEWKAENDFGGYEERFEVEVSDPATVLLTPYYMHRFLGPAKGDHVVIEMATDTPIRMSYEVPGGSVVALLAPRIGAE